MTETQTVGQILREVESLKRQSRRLRDAEKLEPAAEELQLAIQLIEPQVGIYGASEGAGGNVSQNLRDLALQLADCYGSLAGIRRRQKDFEAARDLYGKGRKLEQDKDYGINSTYNQVQWLIIRILIDPGLITDKDADFQKEIRQVLGVFDEQIRKNPQDPWLRSDKGLLQTLMDQTLEAQRSWEEMEAVNPLPAVYKSGLAVLETLTEKLPNHRGLKEAVEHFQYKLGTR